MPRNPEGESQYPQDELAINQGIAEAEAAERNVDDATARMIASLLHGGQATAMYALSSSGAIEAERLTDEIVTDYTAPHTDDMVKKWLDHLGTYRIEHGDRGPVEGWANLWRSPTPETSEPDRERIAIWLGDLAAYNEGLLKGEWIDATQEPQELYDQLQGILRSEPDVGGEEHLIADHEGFQPLRIDEHEMLDAVSRIAGLIAKHGRPVAVWLDDQGVDGDSLDYIERMYDDVHMGVFDSRRAVVEHLIEMDGLDAMIKGLDWPEHLARYVQINMELYEHDMALEGHMSLYQYDGQIYVFWNR